MERNEWYITDPSIVAELRDMGYICDPVEQQPNWHTPLYETNYPIQPMRIVKYENGVLQTTQSELNRFPLEEYEKLSQQKLWTILDPSLIKLLWKHNYPCYCVEFDSLQASHNDGWYIPKLGIYPDSWAGNDEEIASGVVVYSDYRTLKRKGFVKRVIESVFLPEF